MRFWTFCLLLPARSQLPICCPHPKHNYQTVDQVFKYTRVWGTFLIQVTRVFSLTSIGSQLFHIAKCIKFTCKCSHTIFIIFNTLQSLFWDSRTFVFKYLLIFMSSAWVLFIHMLNTMHVCQVTTGSKKGYMELWVFVSSYMDDEKTNPVSTRGAIVLLTTESSLQPHPGNLLTVAPNKIKYQIVHFQHTMTLTFWNVGIGTQWENTGSKQDQNPDGKISNALAPMTNVWKFSSWWLRWRSPTSVAACDIYHSLWLVQLTACSLSDRCLRDLASPATLTSFFTTSQTTSQGLLPSRGLHSPTPLSHIAWP